jgi:hypothetical protein
MFVTVSWSHFITNIEILPHVCLLFQSQQLVHPAASTGVYRHFVSLTWQYTELCDIIMLQVTWLLLTLILYSESRVLVKRSFNDQSVRDYLTEVLRPIIYYGLTQKANAVMQEHTLTYT